MLRIALATLLAVGIGAGPCFAGLIVNYSFDGNALDSSGLGNHGAIVGSPAFVASDSSQAISFNNPFAQQPATQYVRLPNSASILGLSNSSFTFALRYRSTDTSQQNGRLFGNSGGNPGGTGLLHNSGSGARNSESYIYGTAGSVNSAAESATDPSAFTADGLWHWAVTVLDRSSNTFRYYVDEHLIASKPFGSLGSVGFSNLLIGANSFDSRNTFFSARLTSVDEFRLYDQALSADEVRALVRPSAQAVPEPASLTVFAVGLVGLLGAGLRRRRLA